MIRKSAKMKQFATPTRRRSDDIEAKEREAIGHRRTGKVDQRYQENSREKPPPPSKRNTTRRQKPNSPVRREREPPDAKAGYTRRIDRSKPETKIFERNRRWRSRLNLIIFLVKDTRERTRKREKPPFFISLDEHSIIIDFFGASFAFFQRVDLQEIVTVQSFSWIIQEYFGLHRSGSRLTTAYVIGPHVGPILLMMPKFEFSSGRNSNSGGFTVSVWSDFLWDK